MKTTFRGKKPADYLGADLTDRHSKGRRPIDVCGLTSQKGTGYAQHSGTGNGRLHKRPWMFH